jgi:hypothetical protein
MIYESVHSPLWDRARNVSYDACAVSSLFYVLYAGINSIISCDLGPWTGGKQENRQSESNREN